MLRRTTLFIVIIAWCLFYLGHGQLAHAYTVDHLVISEVQITGGEGKTKNDFVEIYNPTNSPINLNGIRLVKQTKSGITDKTIIFWETDTIVSAHGYYLWANDGFTDISTNPDSVNEEYISDNNGIALRQGAENTGEIIDALAWGEAENSFAQIYLFSENPGANQSIERQVNGSFLLASPNPQNNKSPPYSPPPPALPSPQAGEVVINEFVPNPADGQEEWIELYNKTSQELSVEGCKFIDGTGNSIKTLSGSLSAAGFLVFDMSSARLNNSGDIIKLQSADNTIIDTATYGNWDDGNLTDNAPAPTKPGQSIARKSNGGDSGVDKDDFALSDTPTKGAINTITINTITPVGGVQPLSQSFAVPSPKIVINEFVSDPEDEPEWIELYNAGSVSVDLEVWWIEEGSESKTKLAGTMMPGDFKIVSDIAGGLNNKADIIRLKNSKGEVIDWVSYGTWEDGVLSDNAPFANEPNSVIRRVDGQDTDNDKNDFAITSARTKGKANKITAENITSPNPLPSPPLPLDNPSQPSTRTSSVLGGPPLNLRGGEMVGKLFINEIMSNPEGSDSEEWVELFWAGEAPLDLDDFKIDDKDGGSKPFVMSDLKVGPNGYTVIKRELTKIAFNNDSDEARLLDKTGALIDAVEYEEGKEGQSYARKQNGEWGWTSQPTPGTSNIIITPSLPSPLPEGEGRVRVEISNVRNLETGTTIKVKGVVSVAPGVLGSQIFYISDGLSGLQIYSNKKLFPKIDIGDVVEIDGVLSQAQGETRLKTKTARDIQIISKGTAPLARELDEPVFDEENEGGLVKIKGTIINKTNSGFVIDTGAGEISVAIKKSAGINTSELIPGLQVVIAGIVGNSSSGYRLMPRLQEDIQVVGVDEMIINGQGASDASGTEENQNPPYAKATAFAGGGAALAALGIRRRKMFISGFRAALFLMKKAKRDIYLT